MLEKGKGKRAYMLFTGLMIAACLGLYILQIIQPAGSLADAAAQPSPSPQYHSYPSEPVFFANAQDFGFEAQLEAIKSDLPGTAQYRLTRPDLADAHLTLSFREGGVCAFLLKLPQTQEAGELPQNATPIEQDLYEATLGACADEQAWREAAVGGLCAALDTRASSTAADFTFFYAMMQESGRKGVSREELAGDLAFTSYVLSQVEEEWLCVAASRRDG